MLNEWPLISYTLFGQAAAGLYLAVALVREYLAVKTGADTAAAATRRPAFLAGILLAAAVVLSMLHLGSPMGAFRAVNNVGTSWLSREILLTGLFGLLWLVGLRFDQRFLRWATALAGAGMVFAMAMLYQSSVIPAWMTAYTLVFFLAAMLVTGGVLFLAALPKDFAQSVPVGALTALVGTVAQLAALPLYLAKLGGGAGPAKLALAAMSGSPLLLSHVLLVALTAVAVAVVWNRKALSPALVYSALVLGFAGEAALRIIFYHSAFPIAIG